MSRLPRATFHAIGGSLESRPSIRLVLRQKKVKFFGQEVTAEGVFLKLLAHNHEHMGQSIAYARMNGVAPPWSKTGA
jgi:hypothetical protein